MVVRKSTSASEKPDSFYLDLIVFPGNEISSTTINITDYDVNNKFGYYESYFNDCDLIFFLENGTDSFTQIEVLKNKRKTNDKCHENDPNANISHVSFVHKGETITQNQKVVISK